MNTRKFKFRMIVLLMLIIVTASAKASTVGALTATYSNGQTFLTWKNPGGSNFRYKVYRSATKITSSSQLTDANYLGSVRDNSGKNLRKSLLQLLDFYFTIPIIGQVPSNNGLYVATCTDNKRHYYAVTVVNLSNGSEDKTVIQGINSLTLPLKEHKGIPQPVLQNTVYEGNGDINYEYILWGNNQDVPNYPAFNNCGSYGYNFTFVKRNVTSPSPLFVKFDDDNPFKKLDNEYGDNCNILQLDDWLPNGENSYWVGYNVNYDMYSSSNPKQNSGCIRTYTQNKTQKILEWCLKQPNVDTTRVYGTGYSHNGFGLLLTTQLMPDAFAAVQETSAPILIKAVSGSDRETQWCSHDYNLKSDRVDPNTGDTLLIWDLLDMRTMFRLNYNHGIPYMSGIHGKQDVTVGWVQQYYWFDSVDESGQGGLWFWDQRDHAGDGKNFTTEETGIDWSRFSTHTSYPAFSFCSINQDPGNGSPSNGDPYGAINGYLDWDDNSISDEACGYSINCLIKNFYVDGVLQTQYNECSADITFRRLQNFHPSIGQTIIWTVKKGNNIKQQGSFVYDGNPITLKNVKIYKAGSLISFSISGCMKESDNSQAISESNSVLTIAKVDDGYDVFINLTSDISAQMNIVDMMGRIIRTQTISMQAGINTFSINDLTPGAYLLQIKGEEISEATKLIF